MRRLIAVSTFILAIFLLCDSYVKPRVTTEIFAGDSVYNRGLYRSVDQYFLVSISGKAIWTGKPVIMNAGDTFLLKRSRFLHRDLSVDYHDFEFSHGRMLHYPLGTWRGTPTMAVVCLIIIPLAICNLGRRQVIKNDNINDRVLFGSLMGIIAAGIFYML